MKKKTFRNSCLLVLTAMIWGAAFVAQSSGGDAIGPYSFNSIRSLIGSLVLLPVIKLLDMLKLTRKPKSKEDYKTLVTGGILCGIILCLATNFQQLGLYFGTTSGKAGFLTACYILLVPILGIFFKKKCGLNVWIGVFLTVIGLYFLCLNETLTFVFSDLLVLICALMFSFHIITVDHFSPLTDGVRLSCIQFAVCGLLTSIPMLFLEILNPVSGGMVWLHSFASLDAWIPILYAGVCSCGIAYTLQIIGQEDVNPTVASLLMSLESVFSVIAGALILKEYLTKRELLGCIIIFAAVVLAQLPSKITKNEA